MDGRGRGLRDGPAQLRRDGRTLCEVEVAASGAARRRGLLGRDHLDGGMLLSPAASVHTLGMGFPIDVVFLDRRFRVLAVVTMPVNRIGLPRLRARHVLELPAGACHSWGVERGDVLELVASDQAAR